MLIDVCCEIGRGAFYIRNTSDATWSPTSTQNKNNFNAPQFNSTHHRAVIVITYRYYVDDYSDSFDDTK